MKTLQQTTESNFNNFQRFSMTARKDKAHSFTSDSGHQFQRGIYQREIEPEYDIMGSR